MLIISLANQSVKIYSSTLKYRASTLPKLENNFDEIQDGSCLAYHRKKDGCRLRSKTKSMCKTMMWFTPKLDLLLFNLARSI